MFYTYFFVWHHRETWDPSCNKETTTETKEQKKWVRHGEITDFLVCLASPWPSPMQAYRSCVTQTPIIPSPGGSAGLQSSDRKRPSQEEMKRKTKWAKHKKTSFPQSCRTASPFCHLSVHFLLLCDSWLSVVSQLVLTADTMLMLFPCCVGLSVPWCDEVWSVAIMTEAAAGETLHRPSSAAGCCNASML